MSNTAAFTFLALIVLSITTVIFAILFIREYLNRKKLTDKFNLDILDHSEEKSLDVLHNASKKAQQLLGIAELEGIKLVADSRFSAKKLEDNYTDEFKKLRDEMLESFSNQAKISLNQYVEFITSLRAKTEQVQMTSQAFIEQNTNHIFDKFEGNLTNFLTKTEQSSTMAIELELKAARSLIETYKTQQLALVDENIIAMLERTLALVLNKKLSLKDQMDLIYEAVERAKLEKFIA